MSEKLVVKSHRGPYAVHFDDSLLGDPGRLLESRPHFLVDTTVAKLYARQLAAILEHPNVVLIDAKEENKSLSGIIPVFERLVANKVRRDHTLVAIGGGIIQDICCFAASTLMRGVAWRFVPTTLLAQADSCIGSKSSINLGKSKNILGTFNPPQDVVVDSGFLGTLLPRDIHSGIGEILKVHAIDGAASFDRLAADFPRLITDPRVLASYVMSALEIKRRFIEEDEFDRGIRNVFNYGHSFGHAIESATDYAVPHGIAISIGMDMANYVSSERGLTPRGTFERMHPTLSRNYYEYADSPIPADRLLDALLKDKKNTSTMLGLILPIGDEARIERAQIPLDAGFRDQCARFIAGLAA